MCHRTVFCVCCRSPPFPSGLVLRLLNSNLFDLSDKEAAQAEACLIQMEGINSGIRTEKSIYQRKRHLCRTSYTDFCHRRQADQSYMDKLCIPVQGCLLEAVREHYVDFYKDKERWRYLKKLDAKNGLLSLEGFTDSEGNMIDFIVDEAVDVTESAVHAVMADRMKTALNLLADRKKQTEVKSVSDLLDEIESETLYLALATVDRRTLQIVLLKMQGYSTKEIATTVKLPTKSVYRRMDKLRSRVKLFKCQRENPYFPMGY